MHVDTVQVVATLATGRRLLDVVTRPELHGRFFRSEVFDLSGVFHGYHRGRGRGGASDAEMMGGCSVGDSLRKIGTKSGVHALLLLFCARGGAWGLGWADAGGFFDANAPPGVRESATAPPGLLGVAGSALVLRLAFFYARFRLYKARKAQAPGRSKALGLHAAGIPLFDGADPRFLAALSERLVACEYGPGELIIEAGEKEQVPRSLTYTATLLHPSPSVSIPLFLYLALSCSILLYLALSCSISLSPTLPYLNNMSPLRAPPPHQRGRARLQVLHLLVEGVARAEASVQGSVPPRHHLSPLRVPFPLKRFDVHIARALPS
jgi:hypothetical protein